MRSQSILSKTPRPLGDPAHPNRPISAYEAELYARQERARLVGELIAEGILRSWRLLQRLAGSAAKRPQARATAS
jgi:hypothetical protein